MKKKNRLLEKIKQDKAKETSLELELLDDDYNVLLTDSTIENPFAASAELLRIVKKRTEKISSERKKAKSIFDWCLEHIEYGENKKRKGYSSSLEVFLNREGVCGEMSYLYVVLTRSIGLKSSYVSVKKDHNGKRVSHACSVILPAGDIKKDLYVDIAYRRFGIKHKESQILSDYEATERYRQWRNH